MPNSGVHGFAKSAMRRGRRERNLTLRELAVVLDLSVQSVTAWESGDYAPAPGHLAALAKALGVDADDLFRTQAAETNLVGLRERAGLTATRVAVEVGIHKSALSQIEHGYRRLPARLEQPLATLYGRSETEVSEAWQRARTEVTRRTGN